MSINQGRLWTVEGGGGDTCVPTLKVVFLHSETSEMKSKVIKNNNLTSFTKVQFKSLIHTVCAETWRYAILVVTKWQSQISK